MKALGGLANFAWGINKLEYGVEWKDSEEFAATLYRRGMPPVDIPSLTTANLDQVLTPLLKSNSMLPSSQANDQGRNLHFFVCTHGERDCRCGAVGVEVANALREELNRLKTPDGTVDGWSFKVGEVGHVGGHKFAANVLVYPEGHWYGNLRPSDIPSFVRDHLDRTSTSEGIPPSTLLRKHWRGSMHLSGEEQVRQYEMATKSDSASVTSSEPVSSFNPRGGDEVIITYTSHDGKAKHPVIAKIGESLMEVATRAQLEGIEGVCEGKLECATCHVYLSQNPLPAPVPKMFDEEEDMLEYALFRNEAESRLGCQIQVTKELAKWNQEGGVIRLPRY
ncbi:hypothetical protein FRC03_001317 [Tulasnella sp. 419]|nr:hypothetical protein FRC03_001317 [Tulasnella sp. 419]